MEYFYVLEFDVLLKFDFSLIGFIRIYFFKYYLEDQRFNFV